MRRRASAVQLLRHRLEGVAAEDSLDRHSEVLRRPERQVEAGVVLAALEVPDRLVVDVEPIRELLARQPTLRSHDGEPVVQHRVGALGRPSHQASPGASGSTHASAATGRRGISTPAQITIAVTTVPSSVTTRSIPRTITPTITTVAMTTAERTS